MYFSQGAWFTQKTQSKIKGAKEDEIDYPTTRLNE